jgi:hypothetical protein
MYTWRMVLAGLLVAGLGVALVLVVIDGQGGGAPAPTLAHAGADARATATAPVAAAPGAVSVVTATKSATTTVVTSSATTLVPVTVASPGDGSGTVAATSPAVVALQDALAAWGVFASTGRIRDLGDHFVVGGPQRRLLRAESQTIRADPPGNPPYVVTTDDIFTVSVGPTDVVLRTEILWARDGESTQYFNWDIQMQLVDGAWRLLTVEDVED